MPWQIACGPWTNSKLLQLVQSFKIIRAKAVEILRAMSAELLKIGESEGTAEARKAVVEACNPIIDSGEVSNLWSFQLDVMVDLATIPD